MTRRPLVVLLFAALGAGCAAVLGIDDLPGAAPDADAAGDATGDALGDANAGDASDAATNVDAPHDPGSLDVTFGDGGAVDIAIGDDDFPSAIVVQPDGKIVVGGATQNGANLDVAFARLLPDGKLDPSFGSAGTAKFDLGTNRDDRVGGMLLAPDGRLVVAGEQSISTTQSDFAILRLNTNGTRDFAWGGGGHFAPAPNARSGANALVRTSDGTLVLAGYATRTLRDNAVASVDETTGTLTPTFGDGGVGLVDLGGDDIATAVVAVASGQIVTFGADAIPGGFRVTTAHFANGAYVAASDAGPQPVRIYGNDTPRAVRRDADIVVVTSSMNPLRLELAFVGFDGNAESSIGDAGVVTVDVPSQLTMADIAVANAPAPKIVVVAARLLSPSNLEGVRLFRFTPDGALDDAFGDAGIVETTALPNGLHASGVAVQADGRIVVVAQLGVSGRNFFRVLRYWP